MTDIKKLRELAEAATQGEWIRITDHPYLFVNHHNIDSPKAWDCKVIGRFDYETDMEYFRYANPATILALLDRLEAAERDAKRFDWILTNAHLGIGRFGMDWELTVLDVPIPAPEKPEIRQWIDAAMKEQA